MPVSANARAPRFLHPEMLQDGDIVFRAGRDALAGLVLASGSGARFSHAGLLVRVADSWLVYHSTPAEPGTAGGVHAESLEDFGSSKVAAQLGFFRIDGLDEQMRKRVKEYLLAQLGKPFDYRFQYSDDSAMYCTELVLKALGQAGVNLEPAMARVGTLTLPEAAIPPDSLLASPHVHEVRLDPSRPGSFRE